MKIKMNEIRIFKNETFGEIRVAEVDGEPWFCAKDVTNILGYANGKDALAKHCKSDGVAKRDLIDKLNRKQSYSFINENNLYRLIMRSKTEFAERFQDWVCGEVLPTIRKHGVYATPTKVEEILNNPDSFIKILQAFKQERQAKEIAENQLKLQAPKVEYYDEVLTSTSSYTVTQIAKELGLGPSKLNQMLHEKGVQYKQNGSWIPYFKYQDKGFVHSETLKYKTKKGRIITKMSFRWTERGRNFIHKLLNKAA